MNLCACGCGKEAIQKYSWYIPRFIKGHNTRISNPNPKKEKVKLGSKLCSCGCGKEVEIKYSWYIPKFIRGHNVILNNPMKRPEVARKVSEKLIGKKRAPMSEECKKKIIQFCNSPLENKRRVQYMLDGGSAHAASFITNDSKPENELFILACKILPRPIHKYPIYRGKGKRNYVADIGDSSIGVILEFDGYYHFFSQEHKEYHKKRQQEIEEEGWKFLRYNIFQKFPTQDQILEDIKKLLDSNKWQNKY